MPRFETSSQRDTGEQKKQNLFQKLGTERVSQNPKNNEKETQEPRPLRKLTEILKHASTPREKELVQTDNEVKKETRGLLARLREDVEPSKRSQINELRKKVTSNPDISRDRQAVKAYQELIKLTDPERFQREIGTADGIYGPRTRKAYEADKKTIDSPRPAILEALSSNTPKEDTTKKPKIFNISFSGADNIKSGVVGGGRYTSIKAYSENGVTQCAGTARQNLERFGINDAPRASALGVFQAYSNGARGSNMINFVPGRFSPPAGATVADILIDTPQLPHYGADFGHRAVAYNDKGLMDKGWYVMDPYFNGTNKSVPLKQYLAKFQGKQGYKLRGVAFYNQTLPA